MKQRFNPGDQVLFFKENSRCQLESPLELISGEVFRVMIERLVDGDEVFYHINNDDHLYSLKPDELFSSRDDLSAYIIGQATRRAEDDIVIDRVYPDGAHMEGDYGPDGFDITYDASDEAKARQEQSALIGRMKKAIIELRAHLGRDIQPPFSLQWCSLDDEPAKQSRIDKARAEALAAKNNKPFINSKYHINDIVYLLDFTNNCNCVREVIIEDVLIVDFAADECIAYLIQKQTVYETNIYSSVQAALESIHVNHISDRIGGVGGSNDFEQVPMYDKDGNFNYWYTIAIMYTMLIALLYWCTLLFSYGRVYVLKIQTRCCFVA